MATKEKIGYFYLAFAAGLFSVIVAFIVIMGWYTDNRNLKSIMEGYTTMKFNTALCLLFLGKSLCLRSVFKNQDYRFITNICTALAAVVGILTLLEFLGSVISIDQVFIEDKTAVKNNAFPGRMSLITAVCILTTCISFLFAISQKKLLVLISQYLLHCVSFTSFTVIVGYLFKVPTLYDFSITTPMALHTAICFFILTIGASLLNPNKGITGIFTGNKIGNIMARRLFIRMATAMVIISYLNLFMEKYKVFNMGAGSAIFSVAVVLISLLFIWETSKNLNQLEQKRQLISDRLNLIFEAMPNALVMADNKGKIILVNRATEEMFGYKRTELLGQALEILLPENLRAGHPAKIKGFFNKPFTRHYSSEANLWASRKNNEEFPIELGLTPVKTEEGIIALATVIDITQRKTNEKIIQEQVRELKIKNQEMEQFNYIASHDLQEPLRTVANYIMLLEEDFPVNEEITMHLASMKQATTRMSRLIRTLLDYGLLGRNKSLTSTNLNSLVTEVIADLNNLIKSTGAVINVETLPEINCYETEIRQLFQNLINNAIKFRKKDVQPILNIGYKKVNDIHEFYVSDNGIGINPRHYQTIFNIFQRLNRQEDYEGYGVGLANCKKIVEIHGGKIWVESVHGEGSIFKFTINNFTL